MRIYSYRNMLREQKADRPVENKSHVRILSYILIGCVIFFML